MCGIVGIVGENANDSIGLLNSLQRHRGPDDEGLFFDRQCALGHVRLSILDRSDHAQQPMSAADGRYTLVYNGEIYNFRQLRSELESLGHSFRSSGDTEVLLKGLVEFGSDFVGRLNGMFAFALWDSHQQNLLLARDQIGVKPLHYACPKPGVLVFGSEIKSVCAHPSVDRTPNFDVIQQHLGFCHSCSDDTSIQGIKRLTTGSILTWSAAKPFPNVSQYWKPEVNVDSNSKLSSAAKNDWSGRLRAAVENSVSRQMVSDVPVGAFLSGGLDSSLITAAAVEKKGTDFECYTITYAEGENRLDQIHEDAPYARVLADKLGCRLNEVEVSAEVADLWPQLIYHLDEPIADPAAISCYLISKLARENGTKVLLSGQGADELMGGYPRYRAMQAVEKLNSLPQTVRRSMAAMAKCLPGGRSGKVGALLRRARRVAVELGCSADEQFLHYCMSTPTNIIRSVFSRDVREQLNDASPTNECSRKIIESGLSGVESYLFRDLTTYLPNHNLNYTDKMGMAVGVETRVPLLDMEMVELVLSMPTEMKVSRGRTKIALRNAARGIVPDDIIDRPKAGFGAPFRKWLKHDLADMWNSVLSRESVEARGWFDYDSIQKVREMSLSGQADLYMMQWSILTTEIWARQFIDQRPSIAVPERTVAPIAA